MKEKLRDRHRRNGRITRCIAILSLCGIGALGIHLRQSPPINAPAPKLVEPNIPFSQPQAPPQVQDRQTPHRASPPVAQSTRIPRLPVEVPSSGEEQFDSIRSQTRRSHSTRESSKRPDLEQTPKPATKVQTNRGSIQDMKISNHYSTNDRPDSNQPLEIIEAKRQTRPSSPEDSTLLPNKSLD